MWIRAFGICLIASSMSSCGLLDGLRRDECAWVKPITVAPEDSLTRITKEEIVAHNLKFAKFCKG